MRIRIVAEDPASTMASWLIAGIFEDRLAPPPWLGDSSCGNVIARLIASKDFLGSSGDTAIVHGPNGPAAEAMLGLGLGKREAFGPGSAFEAGVLIGKRLGGKPRGTVAAVLPDAGLPAEVAEALVEGVIVGNVGPGLAKSEASRHSFEEFVLVVPPGSTADPNAIERAASRGESIGRAINLARNWVNLPPSRKPPRTLAGMFRDEADGSGMTVEVWDEDRIRLERFGGLLGVAAGSDEPPSFVTMQWSGAGPEAPTMAWVGKGVTFDSGGLSLKPSASMEDMKADMSGAAIIASAAIAVARLGVPINLRVYLALTENMTGGRALKLGDVLTMRNGTTVEVLNTDAEGRLILADALAFAAEQAPSRMLDLATLTGSCMVALGSRTAGLFSNDDETADALAEAARGVGERLWRLPLEADHRESLKSAVADLKNVGSKWGGASIASKFLEEFVGETPWAHLDIAGPAWSDADSPTRDAGATGCFVRTLVRLAEDAAGA